MLPVLLLVLPHLPLLASSSSPQPHSPSLRFVINNGHPRLDTEGRVVDAHSGNILQHRGTYYLYGDHYRATDCCTAPHTTAVYT
eukprot:COSAG04_NODE_477_length_13694_cov_3.632310_3_plen_84_part_00